ncbi:ribose-phosphate pyrophosphokinase [Sorangium cellulosum]|uniref:ribose-phosphate diphosphokinase n=2 Tax=Sorangium cellulosum TaxID=56 RepID=A0A150P0H3_SORCE|nr:ribose-phosphate diphosphokinase [Sorangium cellulosum]AGP39937.1 ribose-phosphate pyrophosphokinase [Sorangium cellulosum So0157-2]KYF47939.1 ribose-phosphate pyrophosphokinase [Sorangium cellulosum]
MSQRRLLITIRSYAYLEPAFLTAGDFERGLVERKSFPDGERYLCVAVDCWGRDVVLLGGAPQDLDWLEIYDLGCAISRAGARSLSIVMPYFGYATMERAVKPGEVVTAKTRARLISAIPTCDAGTRIFLFDLHTDGIEFYFSDSHVTRHLYGAPLITQAVRALMGDRPYVLAATDAGRAKWVQSLARGLGVEPAFVYKERRGDGVGVTGVNADVSGREVVIYDDMVRTGSSLVQAGRAYLAAGASKVHAVASHLVLPGDSLEKIRTTGVFTTLLGTDSHPGSQQLADTPGALHSVAPLLVRALERET